MILCRMTGVIHNLSNPSDMWSEWKKSFLEIVDKHCWQALLRKARVRGRGSPWITSELKKQMLDRDILKIKAIKSNDPVVWAKFKKQRNIVNKVVKQAKQFYYQTSFSDHKGDSRKTWQIINELTSRTSGKIICERIESERKISIKSNGIGRGI